LIPVPWPTLGNRQGDRKGAWSPSVTRNRRLTFRIDAAEGEICDIDLEDYH